MKIFIVTTGEYSDYSIHSVWSTQKQAEDMVKILNNERYNYASFEEYEVDKPCEEKAGFEVIIDFKTGELSKPDSFIYLDENPSPCVLETPRVDFYDSGKTRIYAEHFSVEQALKSARDFRATELAKQSGI